MARLIRLLGDAVPDTLARLRGDLPRYQRLLQQFIAYQQQDPARILALLALQEPAEAGRLAHDLKGTGATLGATRLSALAGAVQQGLAPDATPAQRSAVNDQARALADEMARLAAGLETCAEPVPG